MPKFLRNCVLCPFTFIIFLLLFHLSIGYSQAVEPDDQAKKKYHFEINSGYSQIHRPAGTYSYITNDGSFNFISSINQALKVGTSGVQIGGVLSVDRLIGDRGLRLEATYFDGSNVRGSYAVTATNFVNIFPSDGSLRLGNIVDTAAGGTINTNFLSKYHRQEYALGINSTIELGSNLESEINVGSRLIYGEEKFSLNQSGPGGTHSLQSNADFFDVGLFVDFLIKRSQWVGIKVYSKIGADLLFNITRYTISEQGSLSFVAPRNVNTNINRTKINGRFRVALGIEKKVRKSFLGIELQSSYWTGQPLLKSPISNNITGFAGPGTPTINEKSRVDYKSAWTFSVVGRIMF